MDKITDYSIFDTSPYLLTQFAGSNLALILNVNNIQYQALEDAGFDMYTDMQLLTAVGAQLDVIGIELGLARNGLNDADYRNLLIIQSSLNAACGEPETIIKMILYILGSSTVIMDFRYPAKIHIYQDSVFDITDIQKLIFTNLIPSGVGFLLDAYLIDNNGNYFVDNNGNFIIVTL